MRRVLLVTSALMAPVVAYAQSLQSLTAQNGMPYYLLPASGGCSAATPCSVVTYLSYMDETSSATASDVTSYFSGSFAQANPHTIVIAPMITQPQSETVSWGGYVAGTTPQEQQAVQVVQQVEQSMGNTVNIRDSVVTGGSLGGDGTQAMLAAYGPKGDVQAGVFDAGLSFDAAFYAASPADTAALCGVPLMAVHGTADANQSVTYDQGLQSTINGNPACENSFTFVPIQGAGHGTWAGPNGYSAGVGTGTPLDWLSTKIQALSAGTSASTVAPPAANTSTAVTSGPVASTPAAATHPSTSTDRPAGACVSGVPNSPAADGGFGDLGGQLYMPDGQPWAPRGIGVMYNGNSSQPSAADILNADPGTDLVRLAIYATPDGNGGLSYPSAASLAPYINDLTSHGIFVVLEDHTSSDGQNRGGSTGYIFTGAQLSSQLAWYKSIGAAFGNNPYVGAASTNEPSETNQATGQTDTAGLVAWQLADYDAFRQGGNNGLFWFEINGWNTPSSFGSGISQNAYAGTTNTAFDMHTYPNQFPVGASAAQDAAELKSFVSAAQQFTNQEGPMPVSILEYGDSTQANSQDPNWKESVQAVQSLGLGSAAWAWGNSGVDALNGSDSNYAGTVASYLSGSGATGCTVSAIAATVKASTPVPADTQTTANLTANGAVLPDPPGGSLTIQQVAALAEKIQPVPLAQNAPGGTSPTPVPVSGGTTINTTGDYSVVVAPPGNDTINVGGRGVTVNAIGGQETVNVNGVGTALTLGPYDDTATLHTQGNTVDMGGGSDTVILAYGNPNNTINADAAAVVPLDLVGNNFLAPAPGTGTLTIEGTLASNDHIDLTRALAGTTWNHQTDTMWNYVTAAASPSGCTISVNGQVVVRLPNGSPAGNIGPFTVAN